MAAAARMNAPAQSAPYDVAAVRRDFPILSRQVHGKPLVYLDNAASAQKSRCVIEAMCQLYEQEYSNVHRGVHVLSGLATTRFEAGRETVRRFLNAASANEIVFTRGATEAINLVAQTFGRSQLTAGDEIILSVLEHHANIVPWQLLAQEKGLSLKIVPLDARGQIMLDEYEALLSPRVKLVALAHMSNVLGTVLPVADIVRLAHARGIPVLLDGSQAVTHQLVDLQALDADFYVFSGHKLYGPTGVGVLYGKEALLNTLPPWQGGGDMIETVTFAGSTFKPAPQRFEAGTPAIAEVIGLAAAIEYLEQLGMGNVHAHEAMLLEHASTELAGVPGVTLQGTAPGKGAIISFTIQGAHAQDIALLLDQQGIAVRVGHHCCMPLMAHLGVTGTVRASFGLYNTLDEVDGFVRAVRKAAELLV